MKQSSIAPKVPLCAFVRQEGKERHATVCDSDAEHSDPDQRLRRGGLMPLRRQDQGPPTRMKSVRKSTAVLFSLILHRPKRDRVPSAHAPSLLPTEDPGPLPDTEIHPSSPDLHTGSGVHEHSTTFGDLNADVLHLIALELRQRRDTNTLKALACCSRTLRAATAPVLFKRLFTCGSVFPLGAVHQRARHLRVTGRVDYPAEVVMFASVLGNLPNLTEMIFNWLFINPWETLKICLAHPSITSITYSDAHVFAIYDPPSGEDITRIPIPLLRFTYLQPAWREEWVQSQMVDRLIDQFTREAKWLAALVPNMAGTVEHLDIPLETAPLQRMAELSWTNLRTLIIRGRYISKSQVDDLPAFLSTLPRLQKLSVFNFRRQPLARPPILGRVAAPSMVLSGLRSLTVTYPDPDDGIFSVDTSHLSHLSLRDWPRYHQDHSHDWRLRSRWAQPILTSAECLSILKRMEMPQLTSLELVYLAKYAGSDDELLEYVTHTYPRLTHLELHRYRASRMDAVDHVHITNMLTSFQHTLRSIRLNLDFHDDHGPYCKAMFADIRDRYWAAFNKRGRQIVGILEAQYPYLEYVELLYHGEVASRWPRFLTSRYPEPRLVDSLDMDIRDCEPTPLVSEY